MKKLITIIAICFSLSLSAQDTTAKDTVFVMTKADAGLFIKIVRQNSITVDGKQLGFDDVLQLIQYIEKRLITIPKK